MDRPPTTPIVARRRAPGLLSRRRFVAAASAAVAGARAFPAAARQDATPVAGATPVALEPTGSALPGLEAYDEAVASLSETWGLPGAQLAVAFGDRLVLDRGYGLADPPTGDPVMPTSRIRIASVSKTLTAVAVLALVDDGAFGLDDPVFPMLTSLTPPRNAPRDPRLDMVTVRQLLTHSGGWDSSNGVDPQYQPMTWMEAGLLDVQAPPSASQIVRAMMGFPLAFDPGTKSVYSNFGFNVLGRLIEAVTGADYDDFVLDRVLARANARDMRLGRTRLADRSRDEVLYLSPPGWPLQPSVFPGEGFVPNAYGGFFLEAMDSHGGWIARAHDLVKFALAVDGTRGEAVLRPETVHEMLSTPRPVGDAEPGASGTNVLGLGWSVTESDAGFTWSHTGALTGSNASWLVRWPSGATLAFSANTLPIDYETFFGDLTAALADVTASVTWPDGDLWANDPNATPEAS